MSDTREYDSENQGLTNTLMERLKGVLERGEQAMLYLNRRGLSPFILCPDCRQSVVCPNCSVTLTYHSGHMAACHYCGHRAPPPARCPHCGGLKLKPVGIGTQRVVQNLENTFPGVLIDRLDRDALGKRGALEEIYRRMDSGETSILVGTQMLSKGHDFPGVTLAGILNAEQALDFPDFRSAERTFQIITQVAGRAGRGEKPGEVVVQTYAPDHYAIKAAIDNDHEAFYASEIEIRKSLSYPPFTRLGRILLAGQKEEKVSQAALRLSRGLEKISSARILGPSPAPLTKIRNRFRWHILVFARTHAELVKILSTAAGTSVPAVQITTRVDPVQLL